MFSNINNMFQPKNTLFTDQSSAQTAQCKLTSSASLGLNWLCFLAQKQGICLKMNKIAILETLNFKNF